MNLDYSSAERAFQQEVRDFLAENLTDDIIEAADQVDPPKEAMDRWHKLLSQRGWLAATWPKDWGGTGWSPVERHIFEEECALAGAPRVIPFGTHMLGPVIIKYGSEAQQKDVLPRILSCEDWWCQGYSEPGAGSDLAGLRTRAVRDGDSYVINGQKTWTTLGQHANRIFVLARTATDGKPQESISFFLVDLDTPGIEMRPIRLIEGGHEVNEVFFNDVRIPADNIVGEENKGWTIAKYLLSHERSNIAGVGASKKALLDLKHLAKQVKKRGRPLSEDPIFMARLTEVEVDLEAMEILNLRMLAAAHKNGAPGPETSILKIKGTLIQQALNDLTRRALGPAAAPFPHNALAGNLAVAPDGFANAAGVYFNNRKQSIYGGSNEIQRNILAKHKLGL
ncbi:acyl-CoA dehydrogenase family protein [Halovulum sp. GXIMD14793]